MATYVPAKVSTQYIFYASLVSQANTKLMQVNPTIASGDFKVSIDGGALANLGTLPAVTPAGSSMVKFTLSTSEMAGANATVVCIDAAGSEWCDLTINIPTAARQIDDLAYPATTGRSMVVDAAGLVDANMVKAGASGAGNTITTSGGVTLPAATVASTTNITAGTITTATNLTNAPTAGDFTATMKTSIGTAVAASAVASVTGNVGGNVTGSVGSVVGAVGSVTGNVGGNVTGTVASVVDISTTTLAESSGVPAATATPLAKINFMATVARNKITQTATTQLVRNDGDSGTIATSTVSDDGTTAIRGKFA